MDTRIESSSQTPVTLSRNQINVLATLASGTAIFVTFYPLEVLELRNQLGAKLATQTLINGQQQIAAAQRQSITSQLVSSFSKLGVRGVYKGFSPASVQATAGWVLYYCLFDYTRCLMNGSSQQKLSSTASRSSSSSSSYSTTNTSSSTSPSAAGDMMGAAVAGTLGTVFNTPLQVLKVRMINENTSVTQTFHNVYKESVRLGANFQPLRSNSPTNVTSAGFATLPVTRIHQALVNASNMVGTTSTYYQSSLSKQFSPAALTQTSRQIAATLPQFYRGFAPSLFGVVEGMVQLPLYEGIKAHLAQQRTAQGHLSAITIANKSNSPKTSVTDCIIAACAARSIACVTTYPYQVIRSRLQVSANESMANVVRNVYRNEGMASFWSGCRINLARTVLPAGLLYTMNDWIRDRLTTNFGQQL